VGERVGKKWVERCTWRVHVISQEVTSNFWQEGFFFSAQYHIHEEH
jgi:hypothetical protein